MDFGKGRKNDFFLQEEQENINVKDCKWIFNKNEINIIAKKNIKQDK